MAIDSLQLVRRRIGDVRKDNTEAFELSSDTSDFTLSFDNATVTSVKDSNRDGDTLTDPSDYTVDGKVLTLAYESENEGALSVRYYYYALSDAELQELIDQFGVNGACVEAVRWLIADAARLHDYSRGATSESLNQVVKNLQAMLKSYQGLGDTEDGVPSADMKVLKRTNSYYRGTKTYQVDLSRDDSLSL